MSRPFLGSCLLCGESGDVVWFLEEVEHPTTTTQVVVPLDHSADAAIETREVPGRYFKITRCADRKACDARVAAWKESERRRLAAEAAAAIVVAEPMETADPEPAHAAVAVAAPVEEEVPWWL